MYIEIEAKEEELKVEMTGYQTNLVEEDPRETAGEAEDQVGAGGGAQGPTTLPLHHNITILLPIWPQHLEKGWKKEKKYPIKLMRKWGQIKI